MKKIIYLLITVLVLFPALAYAESQVEVKSIDLIEKSDNTVIVQDASTDGEKINLNIEFYDKDDYALYKIKVKNTTSSSLYINDKSFNQGNENIVYEFIFNDNNIVKAGEEKTFNLKVSYTKEVERFMFRSGKYDASLNEPLVLSDKIIGVPDTMKNLGILGLFLLVIVIACLFIGINSIFKIKYGSYFNIIILLLLLLIIPNGVDALLKVDIPFDSKITVKMVKPNDCTYEGELYNGANYVNGQYVYAYNSKPNYSGWSATDVSGWSVRVNNPSSTDPITTKFCTSINDIPIVDASYAFRGSAAEEIDFSSWDTSNITRFDNMFQGSRVKEIDFTGLDTSKVISMMSAFYQTPNLVKIEAPNLDFSSLTNINSMFQGGLLGPGDIYLNLDNWYTPNLTRMEYAFDVGLRGASSVVLIARNWDLSNLSGNPNYLYSFANRTSGDVMIDLSNWNLDGITSIESALRYVGGEANNLKIDVSGWNTSTITNMNYLLNYTGYAVTNSIEIVGFDTWDTSNVTSMSQFFYTLGRNSKSIKMDLSKWDVSKVTTMSDMFNWSGEEAESFDIGDLSNWDLSSITNMSSFMHGPYRRSTNPSKSNFGTLNIKNPCNINQMFRDVKGLNGTINIYKKPTNISSIFDGTATLSDASVTVNYTSEVDNIDNIIATKSDNSNVFKGELIS